MGLSLRNIGKKITDFASRGYDQVNMFDDGRSYKTRTPTQTASVMSQAVRPVAKVARTVTSPQVVKPVTTGWKRSIAGLGESASGLVDLVLPGTGSSRITDNFRNAGELYDTQIKSVNDQGVTQQHYNPWLYKAGQFGGEIAQIAATAGVGNAVGATAKGTQIATKVAPKVAIKGTSVIPTVGRFVTRPDVMSNVVANVAQGAGFRTSRDQDNNLGTVALDTALTLGVAGAIPVAGKVIQKGAGEVAEKVSRKTNPAYNELVKTRRAAQIAFDKETNPKVRREISQYITRLNEDIRKESGVVPKVRAYGGEKAPVKPKSVADAEKYVVDPRDPMGNSSLIGKIRNELGSVVDDDASMIKLLRKIEKETGRKGLVDEWMMRSNEVKLSTTRANAKIKDDANLRESYRGLSKKELAKFDEYSTARRELSYDPKMQTSKPREELARIRAEGEAKYGARFDARKASIDEMTDELLKEGIIDAKTAQNWKANPDYVRIQRDMEDLLGIQTRASKSRSFGSTKTKQKVTGSKREALSASASDLGRRQELEREIQRNKAANFSIDTLESVGLATKTTQKKAQTQNVIKRFKNGKVEYYEVHPDIKRVVENVSPYQLGILGRILSSPVRIARAGLTGMNPAFAAVNYMRDQISSAIISKDVMRTHNPVSVISGIYNATLGTLGENNSKLWKAFTEFAGDQTVYDELRNAKSAKRMLRELRLGGAGKAMNMATAPVRTFEDIVSITEKATRFQNFRGTYKKAIKEGLSEGEAYQKAYIAAVQNSVDFNRSSNFTRTANLFFPYFNAGVQGSRTMVRAFRDRPIQTSAKSLAFVGIPAMAAVAHNYSSEESRRAYESINQFEKENNFIIVMPGARQKDDGSWEGIIKIPKPQGFREITQPLQDITEAYLSKQPNDKSGWQIAQGLLEGFTGPVQIGSVGQAIGAFTPQQVKPFVQQGMNKDLYSGKDIVPDYMKEGSDNPADWKYDGSSGSAKLIGAVTNRSPIQVEKFVKDVFGSSGSNLINAADNALAKAGVIDESEIGGRSVVSEVNRRMFSASGELLDENKSSGQKYYETVDKVLNEAGLNKNEKDAWGTLHPAKKNFMGEEIFDENKRLSNYTRASIYLQYPKVFIADARIDAMQRAQGKPGNPLYELPKEQLTRVLLKATLPPGAKDPELSNLYQQEWYQDYNVKRSAYYEAIKADLAKQGKSMPASKNTYPEAPAELKSAMDYYSSLPKGTGARSSWIRNNAGTWSQMTAYWSAIDAWENKERVDMGLSPIDNTQDSTSGGYGSYSRFGGRNAGPQGFDPNKYAISLNAGGSIAKPKISVARRKRARTARKASKPTVSIKKSMV